MENALTMIRLIFLLIYLDIYGAYFYRVQEDKYNPVWEFMLQDQTGDHTEPFSALYINPKNDDPLECSRSMLPVSLSECRKRACGLNFCLQSSGTGSIYLDGGAAQIGKELVTSA